jgi:hypothetical protein
MEHTRILPDGAAPAPTGAFPLAPAMIDTLAHHGLRELLFAPIPKVARALAGFDRDQLGVAIEVMIAMLDAADGDPDAENGNDVEDEFALSPNALVSAEGTPGCPVADPADPSFTEWHTRGRRKDNPGIHDVRGYEAHEDAEYDDPAEAVGDEEDTNNAEDELAAGVPPGFGGRCAGCSLSDGDGDRSYAEWHSLPVATRRSGAIDGKPLNDWGQGVAEDDEDDDPDTSVEDGPEGFDPEEDMCSAGDDRVFSGPAVLGGAISSTEHPGNEDDSEQEQMLHDVPMLQVFTAEHNIFTDQRQHLGVSNMQSSYRTNGQVVMSADSGKGHKSKGWAERPGAPI